MLILDQRQADETFAFLTDADSGRDQDRRFGKQLQASADAAIAYFARDNLQRDFGANVGRSRDSGPESTRAWQNGPPGARACRCLCVRHVETQPQRRDLVSDGLGLAPRASSAA